MAEQKKNTASGFINTKDGQTYFYRDDDAHTRIQQLEAHLTSVERTVANVLNEFDIKYNK